MEQTVLSIAELRKLCQATAPAPERETFIGKRARFFSIHFTRLFLKTKITPNQITFLSVLVFFCGISLFLTLNRGWMVLGWVIIFFSVVLDGCDGEVARFRQTRSPVGGIYAEPVSHDFQYGFMFLPLSLAATWSTGNIWFLVLGNLAAVSKLITRLIETRYWSLIQPSQITPEQAAEHRKKYTDRPAYLRFISWAKRNTFSSNGMLIPLAIVALGGWLEWFVAAYGAGYTLILLVTFARQLKALKKLSVAQAGPSVPGSAD
ncbi:MAG: CDP-alcohol phosphatidyltransferase family protein [Patescibacteria group bacterium]